MGYFTFSMFRLSLGVAIPNIMGELEIDEVKAGILFSTPLWSTAAFLALSGYAADRFGRKRLLITGYLMLSFGVLTLALSSSYVASLASLALAGVGAGFLVPSYYSMVGSSLKNLRGFALGLANGIYNLGGFFGSLLVGLFVSLHYWRFAYAIMAAAIFSMTGLQLLILKSSITHPPTRFSSPPFHTVKIGNFVASSVGVFLYSISHFAMVAWLPSFLIKVKGIDSVNASLDLGLFSLAGAIGSPLFGALSDKFGRKFITMVSGLIAAFISLPIFLITQTPITIMIYAFVMGFALLPAWSLFLAIVQKSVAKDFVSSTTGMIQTFGLLGCAAGPILAGLIIINAGFTSAMICIITLPSLVYGLLALSVSDKKN